MGSLRAFEWLSIKKPKWSLNVRYNLQGLIVSLIVRFGSELGNKWVAIVIEAKKIKLIPAE